MMFYISNHIEYSKSEDKKMNKQLKIVVLALLTVIGISATLVFSTTATKAKHISPESRKSVGNKTHFLRVENGVLRFFTSVSCVDNHCSWTAPGGVTSVYVEAWGGGGGGQAADVINQI